MSELKTVMFYKPAAKMKAGDLAKLRKAGFLCVQVEDFDAVSFPAVSTSGVGFIVPEDDMGVMLLRAADKTGMFPDYLGREIFKTMKARAGIDIAKATV